MWQSCLGILTTFVLVKGLEQSSTNKENIINVTMYLWREPVDMSKPSKLRLQLLETGFNIPLSANLVLTMSSKENNNIYSWTASLKNQSVRLRWYDTSHTNQ